MSVEAKPIRLSPVAKVITIVIIIVLALLLINAVGHVLTPFIAAAITAYLFNPLISWLNHRTRVSRAIWILVLYVMVGVLLYGLVRFLGPIIFEQYRELRHQIPRIVNDISTEIAANRMIEIGGITVDMRPFEEPLLAFVTDIGRSLPATVPHLFISAIESVLLFMTYLIVTFYFLLQTEQIVERFYSLVPAPYRAEIRGLGRQMDAILAGYIRGQLLLIPIMAVLTYIALSFLGIHYAVVIAISSGILEIIPLVGPWSAAGIAMVVALFQTTTPFGWAHWVLALVIAGIYFTLRMVEDNFIIPNVVGHAVHLHPVLVIFAIIAGGSLGGPFGLLVAIPVAAILRLLLRYLYRKLIDEPDLPPPDILPPRAHIRTVQRSDDPAAQHPGQPLELPQSQSVGSGE